MGSNTYLKSVASFGYKAQSATATALIQNVDGNQNGRIVLKAFGFTCANVATSLYFMPVIATTTVNGAVPSGNTTMTLTSATIGGSTSGAATLAANDYVCMHMDDGTYHFTAVASVATLVIEISTATDDSMADGRTVWGLGAAGDDHCQEYLLTVSSQNTKELDSGLFYGTGKGYPAMLYYLSASATAVASIDYVTIDYINS
jgi:hypothetical protein